MAGLPEVAAGQGSGLSWMAPGSTFDPVTFATQALNAKLKGKSDEDKLAEQTAKLAEFKPGEQFNIDLTTGATDDVQDIQDYMKGVFMENKDNPYNLKTKMELQKRVADAKLRDERRVTQYKDYQNVKKLLDADKGTQFHSGKMNQNLAFYEDPERFKDMPGFQKYRPKYDEIVTSLQKDPYYKDKPKRLLNAARIEFRDQTKNDLLNPILKPESLTKNVKDKQDILFNTITKEKEVGGVKTKDIKVSRDKSIITFTDGSTQEAVGTDQTATDDYNGDVDIKRSVDSLYEDLSKDEKAKYANSQTPALDWYKDLVYNASGDLTTSKTVDKGGNVVNFGGGYSVQTDWLPTEFSSTIKTTRDAANNVYGETDIDGFSINKGENQLNLDKVVTAPIYYKSNDAAQNAVPTNATSITLAGVKPFMAPTFSQDITFDSFKKELGSMQYDTPIKGKNGETIDNAWDEFLYLFGKKYANAEKTGTMGGIILTKPEQAFLKKIGKQSYIVGGKFVSGEMSWTETNEDNEQVVKKEPAAIIPLSYVNGDIEAVTKIDFNKALDKYKGKYNNNVTDFDYLKAPKGTEKSKENKESTEEDVIIGEEYVPSGTPKKTPFGKEYDSEDSKGYYFKGRMIEEKGR